MKNILVALEGLSATGKTTVGKIVAQRIKGAFYKTPPKLFRGPFRDEVDRYAGTKARLLFYLAGITQASEEISQILTRQSVICDRYLLTTLCYHRALGVSIDISNSIFTSLVQPDFVFLLVSEEKIRLERLQNRGLSFNDEQERQDGFEKKLSMEYMRHNLIQVDNSNDKPNLVAEKIMTYFL